MTYDRFASWIVGDFKIRRQKVARITRYSISKDGEGVATKPTLALARKWARDNTPKKARRASSNRPARPVHSDQPAFDFPAE